MGGIGEVLAAKARVNGMILFVDTDGDMYYYPKSRMKPWLLRFLHRHYHKVRFWLITEAITVE